jgi:hypothetical protein
VLLRKVTCVESGGNDRNNSFSRFHRNPIILNFFRKFQTTRMKLSSQDESNNIFRDLSSTPASFKFHNSDFLISKKKIKVPLLYYSQGWKKFGSFIVQILSAHLIRADRRNHSIEIRIENETENKTENKNNFYY